MTGHIARQSSRAVAGIHRPIHMQPVSGRAGQMGPRHAATCHCLLCRARSPSVRAPVRSRQRVTRPAAPLLAPLFVAASASDRAAALSANRRRRSRRSSVAPLRPTAIDSAISADKVPRRAIMRLSEAQTVTVDHTASLHSVRQPGRKVNRPNHRAISCEAISRSAR